ncbi:MAG: XdhC family protein [Acidobacteriota bacterium]|nr:XdhC family protein [Acidobacteriota bacterium]
MTDLERVLPLWRELEAAGADYVLATIVAVEGPSYRKPGARMLIAQDGRRAGTVSGGCLEAEVAKRAWWLTAAGPVVERYSTVADDGDLPYGSGCGGVVYILLERSATALAHMQSLEAGFGMRIPLAVATVLSGPHAGQRAFAGLPGTQAATHDEDLDFELCTRAQRALEFRTSFDETIHIDGVATRIWADYRPARPGLWIFGAGDDAKPVLRMAREMGWFVALCDGRSHLTTRERFPEADELRVLPIDQLPAAAPSQFHPLATDAAILMSHSYEQDLRVLASLLALDFRLAYIGVLGPQRRTRDLLADAARLVGRPDTPDAIERMLAQLHAPTGLDVGAETPAAVALSILSEVQQILTAASARPLHQVRAAQPAPAPVAH